MNKMRTMGFGNAALAFAVAACGVSTEPDRGQSNDDIGANALTLLSNLVSEELDARGVAEALGISLEDARGRINVQEHSGPIIERLRKQYESRLAGLYIEHEPTHRIVVRLTGPEVVRSEFHRFGDDLLEVAFVTGADRTFADLQRSFELGFAGLTAATSAVQGGYVDERTGDIVIEVLRNDDKAKAAASSLRTQLGAPVRLVELDEPNQAQAVFGSGRLSFPFGGGTSACTNAFVVRHAASNSYGVLTAGHCQSSSGLYSYTGVDSAAHSLGFQARKFDSSADIAWLGSGATDVGPWFYANAWRQLTGRRTQASTAVGNQICRYGTFGGYGCATVYSVAYNPGSSCGPTGTSPCSATFVGLNGATNLCQPGDSGGPWFISTVAAGVHRGGNPSAGLCSYTSTDYAYSSLGLNLLY